MKKSLLAAGVAAALAVCGQVSAAEQGTAKPITTGSVKPNLGNGPADEKSLPSSTAPATVGGTTGATDQGKTVKSMNSNERAKVDTSGK